MFFFVWLSCHFIGFSFLIDDCLNLVAHPEEKFQEIFLDSEENDKETVETKNEIEKDIDITENKKNVWYWFLYYFFTLLWSLIMKLIYTKWFEPFKSIFCIMPFFIQRFNINVMGDLNHHQSWHLQFTNVVIFKLGFYAISIWSSVYMMQHAKNRLFLQYDVCHKSTFK